MRKLAMPVLHAIPRCIEGCDGNHLAHPEFGSGECNSYTLVGWAGHDDGRDQDGMSVAFVRNASPSEGLAAYVNLSVDTTDGENASFTSGQARRLGEMLLAAADRLERQQEADVQVYDSWFAPGL